MVFLELYLLCYDPYIVKHLTKIFIMRVYRWEHETKMVGPLCGETDFNWRAAFREHTCPSDDSSYEEYRCKNIAKREFLKEHIFAWNSFDAFIDNLKINGEERLEREGFVITEWEVTENFCVLQDGQVFFHRHSAIRIS